MPRPLTLTDLETVNGTGPAPCPKPGENEAGACDFHIGAISAASIPGGILGPKRLRLILDLCQPIGSKVRAGARIQSEAICSLARGVMRWDSLESKGTPGVTALLSETLEAQRGLIDLHGALDQWNRDIVIVAGALPEYTLNCLATRALLGYWQDMAIALAHAGKQAHSEEINLGLEIFKLGGSIAGGKVDDRSWAIESHVPYLLVVGIELLDRAIKSLFVSEYPSTAEAIGAYLANTITRDQLSAYLIANGSSGPDYSNIIAAARRKPETVESGILRNRQYVNDDGYKALLRQLGFTDQAEADLVGKLRFEVPGPSDLVRFALRHVFEPDLTARFGHQDEQRPILDFFHQTAGLNYKIYTGPLADTIIGTLKEQPEIYQALQAWATAEGLPAPPAADQVPQWLAGLYRAQGLQEPSWATAYWWSHWVWPAPTQAYQMLFRLRPDRDKTGEPDWMRPLSFTLDDMRSLLRGNDYAPYWRDRLAAIAYRLPPIRQVRQNIANGVWGRPKLVQLFRATGYTDKDADDMADGFIREEDRKKREHLLSIAKKELEEGWEIGTLSDEDFIDTITLSGIPQDEARVLLGAATGARNNRLAKELVGQIRKAYLRGTFSWSEADRFLQQVSIVPRRRSEYHTRWDAERQAGRRDVAMASLRRLVIEGAMDLATYVQRLRNLDYTDQAVEIMLADVRLAIADRERKAMDKLARQAAASEKSRLAALKALEKQRKELAKEMAGHATPAKLKTWYCDGLISWQEVTDRLKDLQWSPHDIDMLLGECDAKREKAGLPTYSQESGRPAPPT